MRRTRSPFCEDKVDVADRDDVVRASATASLTRWPLTNVPLALSASCIRTPSGVGTNVAWWPEASTSGITTSLSKPRPTVVVRWRRRGPGRWTRRHWWRCSTSVWRRHRLIGSSADRPAEGRAEFECQPRTLGVADVDGLARCGCPRNTPAVARRTFRSCSRCRSRPSDRRGSAAAREPGRPPGAGDARRPAHRARSPHRAPGANVRCQPPNLTVIVGGSGRLIWTIYSVPPHLSRTTRRSPPRARR